MTDALQLARSEILALQAELQQAQEARALIVSACHEAQDLAAGLQAKNAELLAALAASAAVQAVPTVIHGVLAEVARATKKFPTWPTDPLHALAVLGEEFGELTKDMLQLTYEPHKTSAEKVQEEAIQTAAMALRLVMSLEQYRYAPCEQHKQQAAPADPVQRPGDHVPGGQGLE